MSKFIKRVLMIAGCFAAAGILFALIGSIGGGKRELSADGHVTAERLLEIPGRLHWLPFHFEDNGRGIVAEYDNSVDYDEDHDVFYGAFTDENIRKTDIRNLDIEIGGGSLTIFEEGDTFKLEKEGSLSCQYYVEGDTLYLKQRGGISSGKEDVCLTLTIPAGLQLEKADIQMGAGECVTMGNLAVKDMEIEVGAGQAVLEKVEAEEFSAEIGAGELTVQTLNTRDCDAEVSMGSIYVESGVISGNLDAEVSMGEVDFNLSDSYDNHSYAVDCAMGEITVGTGEDTKVYSGLGNSMEFSGKNAGGSRYELSCDMGSIYLHFDS